MPTVPRDKKGPDSVVRGNSTSSGLLKSVRDKLHSGKWLTFPSNPSSPNPDTDNSTEIGPVNAPDKPPANTEKIPFPETRVVLALDVSGSTAGKVLRVEKGAVEAITNGLTAAGKRAAQVIPWNNRARSALQLDELDNADSGGGTNPTVLLSTPNCKASLIRSDLWFLLTDGEIDDDLIRSFAHEIGAAQLHGTACVVAIFGSSLERPAMCNISVGKSLMAVVPDCLTLFHDFETGDVRILQCKGCFASLVGRHKDMLVVNYSTNWGDLPKFDYGQLHSMHIPRPRKPEQDTVILSTGEFLDLNAIYTDTMDNSSTQRLLSSHEDLDTLILTAHTRGREDDVRRWINKQRLRVRDPIYTDRPDDGGTGANLVLATFELLNKIDHQTAGEQQVELLVKLETLKEELRSSHRKNWDCFCSELGINSRHQAERDEVIKECNGAFDMVTRPNEHSMISANPYRAVSGGRTIHLSQVTTAVSRTATNTIHHGGPLFIKGFEGVRKCKTLYAQENIGGVYDICGLCGETEIIMCLLLKEPPKDIHTEGFPPPGAKSRNKYPLVLGNYPETDVVASMLCCDACSYLLIQNGQIVGERKFVAALPLIPLQKPINKSNWQSTLAKAFEHRFDDEILVMVLISVICSTIDHLNALDSRRADATISVLKQAIYHLSVLPSSNIATTPPGYMTPVVGINPSRPLRSDLTTSLANLKEPMCHPLLFYPLEGFGVLVHLAHTLEPGTLDIHIFVWIRTLYHFTEKHYEPRAAGGVTETAQSLRDIIGNESEQQQQLNTSIAQLEGTPYLNVEELTIFQRLGDYFLKVQSSGSAAIAAFMHVLLENSPAFPNAEEFFNYMKNKEELAGIFWSPYEMEEQDVRKVIAVGKF